MIGEEPRHPNRAAYLAGMLAELPNAVVEDDILDRDGVFLTFPGGMFGRRGYELQALNPSAIRFMVLMDVRQVRWLLRLYADA